MARRKDHDPEKLRALLQAAAKRIIATKGLTNLTARHLANEVGYTPGTIYNFYRDMDALTAEVNFVTLGELEQSCRSRIEGMPADFSKIRALAIAYVDFAHENVNAWEAIFMRPRKTGKQAKLPKPYQLRIASLFQMIEDTLHECLGTPAQEARRSARLLWACLHGIASLTLDGRLRLVGIEESHQIIDMLLSRYFASEIKGHI